MELQDSILKGFADAVNTGTLSTISESQHIYAVVTRVVEGDGDNRSLVYVRINGAEIETPAITLVKVGVNDRVLATMRSHVLTIIGNISFPALTRAGDMYMTMTDEGLLIGKLNDQSEPTDGYVIVGNTSTSIFNAQGQIVASFGEGISLGRTENNHLTVTENGFAIRNGQNYILANFTGSGMSFRDGAGNVLASFTNNSISIGSSTGATISMCGGQAVIGLSGTTMKLYGGNNVGAIGISNSYGNYKSEVVCEAKNNSPRAAVQLLNGDSTISSLVLSNTGVNVSTSNHLTENGVEVVKVNDVLAFGNLIVRGTVPKATMSNIGVTTPGSSVIDTPISGIPSGYSFCGISSLESDAFDWVIPTRWARRSVSGVPYLRLSFLNFNFQPKTINVTVTWFAIRTSGATVAPDQTIDF